MDATQVLLQAFHLIIQSQINITKALESESVVSQSTVNFTRKTIDPTCHTLKTFKFGETIASHLKIVSTPIVYRLSTSPVIPIIGKKYLFFSIIFYYFLS